MRGRFVRLEPKLLLPYADELLALTTEHGIELHRALALIVRGSCLAALGLRTREFRSLPLAWPAIISLGSCPIRRPL
jgi:hypothetical protein